VLYNSSAIKEKEKRKKKKGRRKKEEGRRKKEKGKRKKIFYSERPKGVENLTPLSDMVR